MNLVVQTPLLLGIGGGVTLLAGILSLDYARAAAQERQRSPMAEDADDCVLPLLQSSDGDGALSGGSPVSLVAYAAARATRDFGVLNGALVCPHCGSSGSVRTKPILHRQRVRRGSAVAITATVASFASKFNRRRRLTKAHCDVCDVRWHVWL